MKHANNITRDSLAEAVSVRNDAYRQSETDANLTSLLQSAKTYDAILTAKPDVIFADEPTGSLDSRASAEIMGFLRRSVDNAGQTIVIVTHDPVSAAYADRALFLADGQIVDDVAAPTAEAVLDRMRRFDAPADRHG